MLRLLRPPNPGHDFPSLTPDLPTMLIATAVFVTFYLAATKRTQKAWPFMVMAALELVGVPWILVRPATWQSLGLGVVAALVMSAALGFVIEVIDPHCRN